MVGIRLIPLALAVVLAGCAVVPFRTATQACDLLWSALNEGGMVPGWYTAVGPVLEECGVKGAKAWADEKACRGYKHSDSNYECEVSK